MKKALITGITGQDGSYLTELLLSKGYEVHGTIRKVSSFNTGRIDHIYQDPHEANARLFLHYGDLSDSEQAINLIYNIRPDEIYNLGAQSHVKVSFELAEYTGNITGLGTTRLLEAVRRSGQKIKFYQASSSEMFGNQEGPLNEKTPLAPCSPYASAKTYSYWMTKGYREGYGLFASSGILFNHESPRRGETFVSRKITMSVAKILAKKQDKLYIGTLDSKRDWGFAPEYVEMMWRMMQLDDPDDFVVGTGEAHTVREFLEAAFGYAGLDWKKYVKQDPRYLRPNEVRSLTADCSKAKKMLKWQPKVHFTELVKIMVDADMRSSGLSPVGEGEKILEKKFGKNRFFK
ncbi:MAG: GDP-mannose 4,6-dehydratase [Candidatus Omnitrophica bacterium]|nr:GDP-mannose 4,6-dehydratase [Candidatus Omnitrophota bacterium]